MGAKSLATLRGERGAATLASGDLINAEVNGATHPVTLDELSTYVTGNTVVENQNAYSAFRGCKVRFAGVPAGLTFGLGAVEWDEAEYDSDGFWSALAPTRITVPAGITKGRVYACFPVLTNTAMLSIAVNGVSVSRVGPVSAGGYVNFSTSKLNVTAGDYIELITEESGSPQGGSDVTYMEFEVLEVTA